MLPYDPGLRLMPVRLVLGQQGSLPLGPAPMPPSSVLNPSAPVAQFIGGAAGKAMAIGAGALAVSAATAWVGFHTGVKEKGILSFTGWTVGILAGFGGVLTLAAIAGLGVIKSAANEVVAAKS